MYRRTTLTRGCDLEESRVVALIETFVKTCIRTLDFNICLVKSNVLTLELLLYT